MPAHPPAARRRGKPDLRPGSSPPTEAPSRSPALRPAAASRTCWCSSRRRDPRRRPPGYAEREVLVAGQGFRWTRAAVRRRQPVAVRRQRARRPAHPNSKPGRDGGDALQRYAAPRRRRRHPITLPELDWATRKPSGLRRWPTPRAAGAQRSQARRLPDWSPRRLTPQQQSGATGPSPSSPITWRQPPRRPPGDPQLGLLHRRARRSTTTRTRCSTSPATASTKFPGKGGRRGVVWPARPPAGRPAKGGAWRRPCWAQGARP